MEEQQKEWQEKYEAKKPRYLEKSRIPLFVGVVIGIAAFPIPYDLTQRIIILVIELLCIAPNLILRRIYLKRLKRSMHYLDIKIIVLEEIMKLGSQK
jgi:hypothetical protein